VNVKDYQEKTQSNRHDRIPCKVREGQSALVVGSGRKKGSRKAHGQGLAEAIAAAIILIPLAFCLLDFIVLIIANSTNDTLAKNCARAAANQDSQVKALEAAQKSIKSFHASTIISADALQLSGFNYDQTKGYVTAQTMMKVHLPMPFPGYSDMTFQAMASEPIVNFTPN
jgi:hypothetical protein